MIRQILNVAWAMSIVVALVTFILGVGSTMPDLTFTLAIITAVSGSMMLIGLAVHEIERRAFKRGIEAAEETARIENDALFP